MKHTDHRTARGQILGAKRPITRRDFLNGASIALGSTVTGWLLPNSLHRASQAGWLTGYRLELSTNALGLRGNHVGSFEAAHRLRDADFWSQAGKIRKTNEAYDLVVVGAGISGLAAAHFYRARRKAARILILDNHDDFGGHAKRNEFRLGGRLALMNGGTFSIDSPRPYSAAADGLLKTLGINPPTLAKKCADSNFYQSLGLGRGLFFDKETFGADKLLVVSAGVSWTQMLAQSPLSPRVQNDIARSRSERSTTFRDYLPTKRSRDCRR